MTGKKITLSAAMRARDVSRAPELTDEADAEPARGENQPDGGDNSRRRGAPRGAASGESESYGEGSARRSERQRAELRAIRQAAGTPAVPNGGHPRTPEKREGLSQAQPDGTAGTGAGVEGSKGGEASLGSTVYPPEKNKRTRHRKRRGS